MRSRPEEMAKGKHFDWTKVGRMCPILDTAFLKRTSRPVASARAEKVNSGSNNDVIFCCCDLLGRSE